MYRSTYPVITSLFLLWSCFLSAQQVSNLRSEIISVTADTLVLDSLSLLPGSLLVECATEETIFDRMQYEVDAARSHFWWREMPEADSVRVIFRVLPYAISERYYHKDRRALEKPDTTGAPYRYRYSTAASQSMVDFGEIDWNGSLARGISFGNNQDVIVNSDLNLQISGMLSPEIEVVGAINDRDIPIQPDGNTQQIQDFDEVFIELSGFNASLKVGDIFLQSPNSYFMNFNKKTRGLHAENRVRISKDGGTLKSGVGLSLARGQYARQQYAGEEGNQGPYRLQGNDGETHIIVLAGTEQVYLDGRPLTRGEENDYVIDYNLGEITFMPKTIITSDSRIVVEFEYAERNYFRSLTHFNTEYEKGRWNIRMNLYAEQDHKNQTQVEELTDAEKAKMRMIGNDIDNAVIRSMAPIATEDRDDNQVLYRMVDTLVETATGTVRYDSVLVNSQDPEAVLYQVTFTRVGQGQGNYIIAGDQINGRVYQWVRPVHGEPQGDHKPVKVLVTPKKAHLYTLGADYQISDNSKVTMEVGMSNNDVNTFSDQGNEDNTGQSAKVGYQGQKKLNEAKEKGWRLETDVHYEHTSKHFEPLQWYRPVEFERNWNISRETDTAMEEHLGRVSVGLVKPQRAHVNYNFSTFMRGGGFYQGFRHGGQAGYQHKGFSVRGGGSLLQSTAAETESQFLRPRLEISQALGCWKGLEVGASAERERNAITPRSSEDSLLDRSFSFDIYELYLKNHDSLENQYVVNYRQQENHAPYGGTFHRANTRRTVEVNNEMRTGRHGRLRWGGSYRHFSVHDTATTQDDDLTGGALMGRAEYETRALRGVVRYNTLYEVGRGQEPKREFTYQEVPAGQGYYKWVDYNDDELKDLDEFEVAPFSDEANYVRVLLPTNAFQRTYHVRFNQSLNVNPKAVWHGKEDVRGLISRFSFLSNLRIDRKTLEGQGANEFNPFELDVVDTALVSSHGNIRNTLFFNRSSAAFGANLTWTKNQNKLFLVNGAESKGMDERLLDVRWNIVRWLTVRTALAEGARTNNSFSANRNYAIQFRRLGPEVAFIYENFLRISLGYEYSEKQNTFDSYHEHSELGGEEAITHDVTIETRYTKLSKGMISARISYVNIAFSPEKKQNSPVGFAMLEGLQPGNNAVWNVTFDRQLGENMQLSLNYDGRAAADVNTVHVGRVQARYMF